VLTFRAVAAAFVVLQIGLLAAHFLLRAWLAVTGFGPLADPGARLWIVAVAAVIPTALAAGHAAVRAAHEPTPRLVTLCAVVSAITVALWVPLEPWLGREPAWLRVVLPGLALLLTYLGGRAALRRLADEEPAAG
jgi:hypothetical protein